MNIDDAAYHTVHDYPGGAAALAPRLGKSSTSLSHEVRPPAGNMAKLGLRDAQRIMALTGDYRMLHAQAAELGQFVLPLPQVAQSDGSMQHLAELAREFGDVVSTIGSVLADGRVTDNEMRGLERQWGELVAAGQHMLEHFAKVNAAGKPSGETTLRSVA